MLTISPISNNSNKNNNSQPSFGLNLTKSSIKFLKKSVPNLIRTDEDFGYAQKAISNFAELAKRNDGLTLTINEVYPSMSSLDLSDMVIKSKKSKLSDRWLHDQVIDSVIDKTPKGKSGLHSYVSLEFKKISDTFEILMNTKMKDEQTMQMFSNFKINRAEFEQNGKVPYALKSCYYYWNKLSGNNEREVTAAQDLFNISEYLKTQDFIDKTNSALNSQSNPNATLGTKISSILNGAIQKTKQTYYKVEDFVNYFGYQKEAPVDKQKSKILTKLIDEQLG